MGDSIIVITPEITPGAGGVADYTLRVIEHWPDRSTRFRFIVPKGKSSAAPDVDEMEPSPRALVAKLPPEGGTVWLQYSAYGYDRLGYPRWLLHGLRDWKRQTGGHLCIMFHEIWTFWPVWNKNFVVQQMHRRAIGQLVRAADSVFTTTQSQGDYLSQFAPARPVTVLPVGANILPSAMAAQSRMAGTAVLFGMGGTRVRIMRENVACLLELARAGRLSRIITVGGGATKDGTQAERELLESLPLPSGFEQVGARSATDVSQLLATAEFAIGTKDSRGYTKSSSFMSYAAHGLNVLSPCADSSSDEPICLLLSQQDLMGGLTATELERCGLALRTWYERTASWPHLARSFAHAIQSTT